MKYIYNVTKYMNHNEKKVYYGLMMVMGLLVLNNWLNSNMINFLVLLLVSYIFHSIASQNVLFGSYWRNNKH